ncbi:hypothetical protein N8584_02280 [bacterium]|nr:hypothetical protein [bacterium]
MLPGGGKAWHFEHSRLAKRSGASAPAGPAALRNPARHRAKPGSLRGGVSALGQVSQIIGWEEAAVCHPKTSKKPESGK